MRDESLNGLLIEALARQFSGTLLNLHRRQSAADSVRGQTTLNLSWPANCDCAVPACTMRGYGVIQKYGVAVVFAPKRCQAEIGGDAVGA
jgi:hypothetical protein